MLLPLVDISLKVGNSLRLNLLELSVFFGLITRVLEPNDGVPLRRRALIFGYVLSIDILLKGRYYRFG